MKILVGKVELLTVLRLAVVPTHQNPFSTADLLPSSKIGESKLYKKQGRGSLKKYEL